MTSPELVLYVACLFLCKMAQMNDLSSSFRQESGFISTHVGRSIILQCFYDDDVVARYYWYKQTLGEKLRLMATFYTYNKNGTFYDEYENNPRFTLDTENGKNHLKISDLRTSDSATYYCASRYSVAFEFGEGATVSVKGSGLNSQALVHQSGSETIQPGGSVTLSCTVHTGTCDGEHSVYWFKDSEESHPGLIYTHGDRNDQCERKPETQTQTCVYNLPMENLNRSHAGTYYCAVASCGHILFGNGTKLDVEDEGDSLVLVYFLSSALAFTTILSVLLAFFMYMIRSHAGFSASSTMNAESCKDEENLHYAALNVKKSNSSRRLRADTEDGCVYSSVKQ
ncbi:immunoglobulin alpha-2 heavy chain-like isoform X2 [Seriola aureovittata]|uniref:immunoglobulin alpha-2 heavy chain-like isoform X2 n=1 Tax=Seriola aureovittata TaxID=2871759 RepID=UPI0024BD836A|nr:immunoglobulin alpha-2 heavy chain-like isoform X2 [Seriola aureovittata]